MDEQKKRELSILKSFAELFGLDYEDIIPDESPDFILKRNEKKLGIEVTEIYQPSPEDGIYLSEQESLKNDVIQNSREELDKLDLPPMDIYVSFNDEFRINFDTTVFALKKPDRYDFPKIIVDLVQENIPDPGYEIEIYGVDCERLPIKINSITIRREEYHKKVHISTAKGGILPPLDFDTLQETITSHDDNVEEYREKCEDCWLLIASNAIHFEKSFDLERSQKALEACYEFNFDRVYLLEEGFGKFYQINPCT